MIFADEIVLQNVIAEMKVSCRDYESAYSAASSSAYQFHSS